MSMLDRDFVMRQLGFSDSEQESVDFCIEWVEERARSYIGRPLASSQYTWLFDGRASDAIILPVCPVVSVDELYLDSSRAFDQVIDPTSYHIDTESGIITLYDDVTPRGRHTVKVVATAGYTSETLPADLKMAFLSAISHHMLKLVNKSFGLASQSSPDGVNMSYELELPSDTKRIFDAYKEVRV